MGGMPVHVRASILIVLYGLLLLGVGLGVAHAATASVVANPNAIGFGPDTLSVNVGDTVTITKDAGFLPHNAHWNDQATGCPASPTTDAWTCSRTFDTPGTFIAHC